MRPPVRIGCRRVQRWQVRARRAPPHTQACARAAMPCLQGPALGSKARGTYACAHPHANARTERRALARAAGSHRQCAPTGIANGVSRYGYGLGLDSVGPAGHPRGAEIGAEGSAAARGGARFSMTMGCGYGGTAAPTPATCTPAGSGVLEGSTAAPCSPATPTHTVHRIHSQLFERVVFRKSGRERTVPPGEEPAHAIPPRHPCRSTAERPHGMG